MEYLVYMGNTWGIMWVSQDGDYVKIFETLLVILYALQLTSDLKLTELF